MSVEGLAVRWTKCPAKLKRISRTLPHLFMKPIYNEYMGNKPKKVTENINNVNGFTFDMRHEKTDLKVFVVIIPKEGMVGWGPARSYLHAGMQR